MSYRTLSKVELASRVAMDIPDGSYVNLGIGMPTTIASYLPPDRDLVFHSENGILGMGPTPLSSLEDEDLVNAGKEPVSLVPGAALFHQADSFAIVRGGHLDICVLGAFQVSQFGDLANWSTGAEDAVPAVGGAMDLAVGARQTWVMMKLLTAEGVSKLVPTCTYPLTARACVSRIYTDHGTVECTPAGLRIVDLVEGLAHREFEQLIGMSVLPEVSDDDGNHGVA